VHSDVGGGYRDGRNVPGVSDITLAWMLERAMSAGLALDHAVIATHPLRLDPLTPLHDSKNGLYRLTPGIDRPIGLAAKDPARPDAARAVDPTQSVHPSAIERWDKDRTYRPVGLRNYFKRTGDPRGTEP